jgi:hypothetical protein
MEAEDQRARNAWIERQDDLALMKAVEELDHKNTARMKEIVAQHGWPGKSLVGEDGARAAWLLVQHADDALTFQQQCLALIEPMVALGEVRPQDLAYLRDRLSVHEKRPQRYGTQFGPDGEPLPIEDPANVDARRAAVGLEPLAKYREELRKLYKHDP